MTSITTGANHTCAVVSGSARCWGENVSGKLGDGTTTPRTSPVQVSMLTSDVTAIAAGGSFTCALFNGAAVCWGLNASGQLGDGTTTTRSTPDYVLGLDSGVTAISANGWSLACAVVNGAARCWGGGSTGDGTAAQRNSPVQVLGLTNGVSAVAAGGCAVVNGSTRCWGGNYDGQVGDGTTQTTNQTPVLSPVQVIGLTAGVTAIAGGVPTTARWRTARFGAGARTARDKWARAEPPRPRSRSPGH